MIKDDMGGKSRHNPFAEKYRATLKARHRELAKNKNPKIEALKAKKV